MKKTIIIAAVVLLVILVATLLLGAGKQTKKLDADSDLSFIGRTAICQATVTGERKNDFIQVTMRLKQENVIWKTWYKEGYFQVTMEGSCKELIKNKVYTLEISATINGEPQEVLMVRKACAGVVPTEPTTQPTVPTAPTTIPTTAPTTQPTVPPTTQPSTPALDNTGYAFVYQGEQPYTSVTPDLSNCVIGHLYWVDKETSKVTPILEEQVIAKMQNGDYVYYVKADEPNKIYQSLIGDFSQHKLTHETIYGVVSNMTIYPRIENYLQFVADHKKFVVLDFATGEETLLMEQYKIEMAYIGYKDYGVLSDKIRFRGKPTGEEPYNYLYSYNRITGEVTLAEDDLPERE